MPTSIKIKQLVKKYLTSWLQRRFLARARNITMELPSGPVLVIAPHPDDETLGCGGTIALLKSRQQNVRIIVVTDGSHADVASKCSREELASMRRKETVKAMAALGVPAEDIVFLPYEDTRAHEHINEICNDLASQIWLANPCLILAPSAEDAHTDHQAVAQAVRKLYQEKGVTCRLLDYPIWFWPKYGVRHVLSKTLPAQHRKVHVAEFLELKQTAIHQHVSQQSEAHWPVLEDYHLAGRLREYELFFETRHTNKK